MIKRPGGWKGHVHPTMTSSRTATLFSERQEFSRREGSFVVSILMHGAALGLLSLGIIYQPEVVIRPIDKHDLLRHLELHSNQPSKRMLRDNGEEQPGVLSDSLQSPTGAAPPGNLQALTRIPIAPVVHPILAQPDLSTPVKLTEEVPVPNLLIWSSRQIPVNSVVAPLPELVNTTVAIPSINPPNVELDLAEFAVSK